MKEILQQEDKTRIIDLIKSDFLNSKTIKAIDNLRKAFASANDDIREKDSEIDLLNNVICEILKTKIGDKIYWASENWSNYETHTIVDVRYEVWESEFFDTDEIKYKGKKLVVIEIEDSGLYLAHKIGGTLFFDEEEAKKHTRTK